jgi:CHAD domain-containing protein/DNA-binding transcriptional ArsR family regulator
MEIEAKFSIPDRSTFELLCQLEEVTGYRLDAVGVTQVHDRYFDTDQRDIIHAGYACRVRHKNSRQVATLKGLGGADAISGVHQRAEYEVAVDGVDPSRWPESTVRGLTLQLSGGRPLTELFSLSQMRHVFLLYDDGGTAPRPVAELSLDEVRPNIGLSDGGPQPYYELEVELLDQGTQHDLQLLASDFKHVWGLQPEAQSKFERGMALLETVSESSPGAGQTAERLAMEERAMIEAWLASGSPPVRRRAQIVLLSDEGLETSAIAQNVGLSQRQVRRWLAAFRDQRMGIFPSRPEGGPREDALPEKGEGEPVESRPVQDAEADEPKSAEVSSVDELLAANSVDLGRVEYVRNLALRMFDETHGVHRLGPGRRSILSAAAALAGLGQGVKASRRYLKARDLILSQPISGFTPMEQDMLASVVAFHRKKVRRGREQAFLRLPNALQQDALALAALLRMADGIDGSRTQSTAIRYVEAQNGRITVVVDGTAAGQDATAAQKRSDLWHELFDVGIRFLTSEQFLQAPVIIDFDTQPLVLPELASPGLMPDDAMSEAGRKTLWFHFLRMLKHESGTRLGEDIEELHDMRVATRRMRAAVRVFGDFFEPDVTRAINKGIRRVTRALGPVRDLDVFEEKAARYLGALPGEMQDGLDPLLETWHAQRAEARDNMLRFLDSEKYSEFKREFSEFLQTKGAGARPIAKGQPIPFKVRHVAPRLIYTRYETVRAYETVLEEAQIETLHALRIDCKYLRYTLEFMQEVLGSEVDAVIDEVKAMQDHLGDLNDAEVAIELLSEFLDGWDAAQTAIPLSQRRSAEGIVTYLASRHAEKHRLVVTFPDAWEKLNREEVRRSLALAVAAL